MCPLHWVEDIAWGRVYGWSWCGERRICIVGTLKVCLRGCSFLKTRGGDLKWGE